MNTRLLRKIRKNISVYKQKDADVFVIEDRLDGLQNEFKTKCPKIAREHYYGLIENHLRHNFGQRRKSNYIKIM